MPWIKTYIYLAITCITLLLYTLSYSYYIVSSYVPGWYNILLISHSFHQNMAFYNVSPSFPRTMSVEKMRKHYEMLYSNTAWWCTTKLDFVIQPQTVCLPRTLTSIWLYWRYLSINLQTYLRNSHLDATVVTLRFRKLIWSIQNKKFRYFRQRVGIHLVLVMKQTTFVWYILGR